jgi:hypothetical protein
LRIGPSHIGVELQAVHRIAEIAGHLDALADLDRLAARLEVLAAPVGQP